MKNTFNLFPTTKGRKIEILDSDQYKTWLGYNEKLNKLIWDEKLKIDSTKETLIHKPIAWKFKSHSITPLNKEFQYIVLRTDEVGMIKINNDTYMRIVPHDINFEYFDSPGLNIYFITNEKFPMLFGIGSDEYKIKIPAGKRCAGHGELKVKVKNYEKFINEFLESLKHEETLTNIQLQRKINVIMRDFIQNYIGSLKRSGLNNEEIENRLALWNTPEEIEQDLITNSPGKDERLWFKFKMKQEKYGIKIDIEHISLRFQEEF